MTDFTNVSIPQPKNWQDFERLSRLLFEYVLGDPRTENNGRIGQPQAGVDISGRRGGDGPLVGVQCKGKDVDYGGVVGDSELRREVKNSEKFRPAISEFILVTTAPADAKIQEAARLLQIELENAGRKLSISVWGWERIQQEITRYGEVLKAFHPDATPFTDVLLDSAAQTRQDNAQIKEMLEADVADRRTRDDRLYKLLDERLPKTQLPGVDAPTGSDPLDKALNDQIDSLRDLIRDQRPRTALTLLLQLKDKAWETASNKIRFRILGNLGAAHFNLGENDAAADYFINAAEYDPDNPIAFSNKIVGLILKDRKADARTVAAEVFRRFPDNVDLALQRLQARDDAERIDEAWHSLPDAVRDRPEIMLFRIAELRAAGNPAWQAVAAAVTPAGPTPVAERLNILRAEAVIDRILSKDRSALGSDTGDVPDQSQIEAAATTLDQIWQAGLKRETPPYIGAAHNAALAYNILGRVDDARRLLDQALAQPGAGDETKRLRLALYPRDGDLSDAIRLADTMADTPQNRVIRAELKIHSAPNAARALVGDPAAFDTDLESMGASFVVTDSYLAENNFEAATAEAERLKARYPNDPQPYLALYRIKSASAAADPTSALDEAVSKINEGTDFVSRFMAADELAKASRWDDVIRLLRPNVSTHFDSPALRALVVAAANGDRREVLKAVLDDLSPDVAKRSFYLRSRIALSIRVQDITAAEQQIRQYLAENPRSLEMQLQLMHALFRQDKRTELRTEVSKPATAFDGPPIDFIKLAQFKDGFGDWHEGHALAYKTLLENFEDVDITMAYVAIFLSPGHSTGLEVEPAVVAEDTIVGLEVEGEAGKVFTIEADAALRPSPQYIAPTHAVARTLIGHAKGDTVYLPGGTSARIAWIKPKVLHALHEVLENFQRMFPDSDGLERVIIDPDKNEGFGEIVERLKQRSQAIEAVFSTYDAGLIPIACVARSLGKKTVDTFLALIQSGRNIRVCEGTQLERDIAASAIRANERKGCVLDPIALHLVRRLGLEDPVSAVCGPIGTIENRIHRLTQRIYELEQNLERPDTSLSWSNGQTFRHEVTPEEKRAALGTLQADKEWMQNLSILPAQGIKDPPAELNELTARFGSSFLDEARAAQGAGRLFICEDQALRLLAGAAFSVPATWLQPVLMLAKDGGHMSSEAYRTAITAMIDARLQFISVDPSMLNQALHGTASLELPEGFSKIASRLGGAKADLASHLSVSFRAIRQFWHDEALPWTLRQAAVGRLLENLCRERPLDQVHVILDSFAAFSRRVIGDGNFDSYLYGWVRGHFIPM
jgi:tetratricopeptide (TPR) repeat protein